MSYTVGNCERNRAAASQHSSHLRSLLEQYEPGKLPVDYRSHASGLLSSVVLRWAYGGCGNHKI